MFNKTKKKNKKNVKKYEMPIILASKYNKFRLLALLILIGGTTICFIMYDGFEILKAMLFPIVAAILLYGEGYLFKNSIEKNGYEMLSGICIDHKHASVGEKLIDMERPFKNKRVNGLIVECTNKIIVVPVFKLNDVPPIGSKVNIYIPMNATERINNNGFTIYSDVYGYEMLPGNADEILKNSVGSEEYYSEE